MRRRITPALALFSALLVTLLAFPRTASMTAAAAALGLAFLRLSIPVLGRLVGPDLAAGGLAWGRVALFLPPLALLAALAAGGYPSFFAASVRPLLTMRGGGGSGPGARRFRARGLVLGFQFMVSVGFVTAAVIVFGGTAAAVCSPSIGDMVNRGFDDAKSTIVELLEDLVERSRA